LERQKWRKFISIINRTRAYDTHKRTIMPMR